MRRIHFLRKITVLLLIVFFSPELIHGSSDPRFGKERYPGRLKNSKFGAIAEFRNSVLH